MEVTEESDALNEIQELEIHLENSLEESRRQAREIVKSARTNAAEMVNGKEKELLEARRSVAAGGDTALSMEVTDKEAKSQLDDNLVRKLAGDLLKTIIR